MAGAMLHASMCTPTITCTSCGLNVEVSQMGDHSCIEETPSTDIPLSAPKTDQRGRIPRKPSPLSVIAAQESDSDQSDVPVVPVVPATYTENQQPLVFPFKPAGEEQKSKVSTTVRELDLDYEIRHIRPISELPPIDPIIANAIYYPEPLCTPTDSTKAPTSASSAPSYATTPSPAFSFPSPAPDSPAGPHVAAENVATSTAPTRPPRPTSSQSPLDLDSSNSSFLVKTMISPVGMPLASKSPQTSPELDRAPSSHARKLSSSEPKSAPLSKSNSATKKFMRRMNSISLSSEEQYEAEDTVGPMRSPERDRQQVGLFRRKSSKKISKSEISHLNFSASSNGLGIGASVVGSIKEIDRSAILVGGPGGLAPPRPDRTHEIDKVLEQLQNEPVPTKIRFNPRNDSLRASRSIPISRHEFNFFDRPTSDSSTYSTQYAWSPERSPSMAQGLPTIDEDESTPFSISKQDDHVGFSPLPRLPQTEYSRKPGSHTPTESSSSSSSKGVSEDRSPSLWSSPATSHGSAPSSDATESTWKNSNFSRLRAQDNALVPPVPPPPIDSNGNGDLLNLPTNLSSPSQSGSFSDSATSPGSSNSSDLDRESLPATVRSGDPHAPTNTSQQEKRRRPPASKGPCKGCGQNIYGKSVQAADGRLTGRYHRECFVCRTCKAPFESADFYVWNDEPQCHYHYHLLNHSLCTTCNKGIEGRYLETNGRSKYHLECFTCCECSKSLTQDYFEMNGNFYCELHARNAFQKTSPLGPGRRFPERRTTRIMNM